MDKIAEIARDHLLKVLNETNFFLAKLLVAIKEC